MAHFAEVNHNNLVLRILVVPDDQEHRGQEFLAADLSLGGTWIQCSYNNKIRKQYPGPGYSYDPSKDIFIAPRPFESWFLDENNDWQAPVLYPSDGRMYIWDEDNRSWLAVEEQL